VSKNIRKKNANIFNKIFIQEVDLVLNLNFYSKRLLESKNFVVLIFYTTLNLIIKQK